MNPRKQECHGLYLYGSGYFEREDAALGTVNNEAFSFCDQCPHSASCQEAHRKRAAEVSPAAVERFEVERRIAERRGIGGHLFAMMRMRNGDPDPYIQLAVRNFKTGVADRRAEK